MNGGGIAVESEIMYSSPTPDMFEQNAQTMSPDYRFSSGQLPLWAKKHTSNNEENVNVGSTARSIDPPKGRWAQRVQQSDGITVKSVYDSDEVIPFPGPRGAFDSDAGGNGGVGSKDSSIDSGTETKCSSDYRRDTMVIKRVRLNIFFFCH